MPIFGGDIRMHAPFVDHRRYYESEITHGAGGKTKEQDTVSGVICACVLRSSQAVSRQSPWPVQPLTWLTSSVFTGQVLSGVVDTATCLNKLRRDETV